MGLVDLVDFDVQVVIPRVGRAGDEQRRQGGGKHAEPFTGAGHVASKEHRQAAAQGIKRPRDLVKPDQLSHTTSITIQTAPAMLP